MPNSDNTYGTFNKQTLLHTQSPDGSTLVTEFASVDAAKSHIYSTNALAVWDECCTNLQWSLVADSHGRNTQLKVTFDFGTKGTPDINPADDWAGQWTSRRQALVDANDWMKDQDFWVVTCSTSTDHLF